jgi:hypothetical protein
VADAQSVLLTQLAVARQRTDSAELASPLERELMQRIQRLAVEVAR